MMRKLVSLLLLCFLEVREHLCEHQGAPKYEGCSHAVVNGEGVLEVENGDNEADELAQCDHQRHCQ